MMLLLLQLYGKIIIPKEYMQHKFVLSFKFFLYSPNQSKVMKIYSNNTYKLYKISVFLLKMNHCCQSYIFVTLNEHFGTKIKMNIMIFMSAINLPTT